jgi:hypothetical protein
VNIARKQARKVNLEALRQIKAQRPDIEVIEFSCSHLRITAARSVDYWPSTGRAWLTDHFDHQSEILTPAEAVELACQR